MGTSARAGLPWPEDTDAVDVPGHMQSLAVRVAELLGTPVMTTLERDALAGDDLYPGRAIINSDVGRVQSYDGANWIDAETPAGAQSKVDTHQALGNPHSGSAANPHGHGQHSIASDEYVQHLPVDGRTGDQPPSSYPAGVSLMRLNGAFTSTAANNWTATDEPCIVHTVQGLDDHRWSQQWLHEVSGTSQRSFWRNRLAVTDGWTDWREVTTAAALAAHGVQHEPFGSDYVSYRLNNDALDVNANVSSWPEGTTLMYTAGFTGNPAGTDAIIVTSRAGGAAHQKLFPYSHSTDLLYVRSWDSNTTKWLPWSEVMHSGGVDSPLIFGRPGTSPRRSVATAQHYASGGTGGLVTGAMAIHSNAGSTSTMMVLHVQAYSYRNTSALLDVKIAGYNYSAGFIQEGWVSRGIHHPSQVRLVEDANGNRTFLLGDVTDEWYYPSVWVDFYARGGQSHDNWSVSFVSDLTGYTTVSTLTNRGDFALKSRNQAVIHLADAQHAETDGPSSYPLGVSLMMVDATWSALIGTGAIISTHRVRDNNHAVQWMHEVSGNRDSWWRVRQTETAWSNWRQSTTQALLDSHTGHTANPHGVTAAQAGAVPAAGGAFTGAVDFGAGVNVNGGPLELDASPVRGGVVEENLVALDTSYTLALADASKIVLMRPDTMSVTLTIPANASAAFPIGTVIEVSQWGAGGTVTISPATGVDLRSPYGQSGARVIAGEQASATLRKRAADQWVLQGDLQ